MQGNITLTWKDPTTLSDGKSSIPAGDFDYVDVQMSADQGATFTSLAHVNPGIQTYEVTSLVPGTYDFKVYAVDAHGQQSSAATATATVVPNPLASVLGLQAVAS